MSPSRHRTPSRPRALMLPGLLWLLAQLAGCGAGGAEYFPPDKGRWWEYRLTVTILEETARQKQLLRNVGEGRWGDEQVLVREHTGGEMRIYHTGSEGVRRVASRMPDAVQPVEDPPGHFVIKAPLEPGTAWPVTSRLSLVESRAFEPRDLLIRRRLPVELTYTIEALDDTVEVPAGRFQDCLRVRATGRRVVPVDRGLRSASVDVEAVDWYAPGVGLVKSTRREYSDSSFLKTGEFLMELERSGG